MCTEYRFQGLKLEKKSKVTLLILQFVSSLVPKVNLRINAFLLSYSQEEILQAPLQGQEFVQICPRGAHSRKKEFTAYKITFVNCLETSDTNTAT
jgi:hypothetical protein